jgi:hypothetical protein
MALVRISSGADWYEGPGRSPRLPSNIQTALGTLMWMAHRIEENKSIYDMLKLDFESKASQDLVLRAMAVPAIFPVLYTSTAKKFRDWKRLSHEVDRYSRLMYNFYHEGLDIKNRMNLIKEMDRVKRLACSTMVKSHNDLHLGGQRTRRARRSRRTRKN